MPYAIIGLAMFQATCVVRDGCPGPRSAFGLIPSGLTARQFPVGIAGGITLAAFAWWLSRTSLPSHTKVLISVLGIGVERTLAGEIAPSLASAKARDGILMLIAFTAITGWWAWFERQERQWNAPQIPKGSAAPSPDETAPT